MCLTGGVQYFKRRVLNVYSIGELLTSIGSEFHSRMVAGKNDFVVTMVLDVYISG